MEGVPVGLGGVGAAAAGRALFGRRGDPDGGGPAGPGAGGAGGLVVAVLDASASSEQRGPGGVAVLDAAKAGAQRLAELSSVERPGSYAVVVTGGRVTKSLPPRRPLAPGASSTAEVIAFEARGGTAEPSAGASSAEGLARLKGVRAGGTGGTPGVGLGRALELSAAMKLRSGSDNFGRGWWPGAAEPSLILLLTDGSGEWDPRGGGLGLPPLPASDLFRDPVRWDQRVCMVHIPAEADPRGPRGREPLRGPYLSEMPFPSSEYARDAHYLGQCRPPPVAAGPLGILCAETGGRLFQARTMKGVQQAVEMCFHSAPGVAVDFEALPAGAAEPDGAAAARALRGRPKTYRLFIRREPSGSSVVGGTWPIPEAFWPEGPAEQAFRQARPLVSWVEQDVNLASLGLPGSGQGLCEDIFEVDGPPAFRSAIQDAFKRADKKQSLCWLLYVRNSIGDGQLGQPFGYIALGRGGSARVVLLPYNFPTLTNLMRALSAMGPGLKLQPPPAWRMQLESYLGSVPRYYLAPLRVALRKMGLAPHAMPEVGSAGPLTWAPALQAHQARAAAELEAIQAELRPPVEPSAGVAPGPGQGRRRLCEATAHAKFGVVPLPILEDPLSVPRERLVHQVALTVAALRSLDAKGKGMQGTRQGVLERIAAAGEAADRHSVPVAAMGDYEEAMQQQMASVLRDPFLDESEQSAHRAFGNPFRREPRKRRQSKRRRGGGGGSPGSSVSWGGTSQGSEGSLSREDGAGGEVAQTEVTQKRVRAEPQGSLALLRSVVEGLEGDSIDMSSLLARRGQVGESGELVLPESFERLQEPSTKGLSPIFAALVAHRLNFGYLRPRAGAPTLRGDVEALVDRARGIPADESQAPRV